MNKFIVTVCLFSFYFVLNAQISQPLSSYRKVGLGDFNFAENTATQSMGGLSTIYISPFGNEINFFNPAANNNIEETAFNVSSTYDHVKYKNSLESSSFNQLNFERIALAFPINKKIKAGIGLRMNSNANNESFDSNNLQSDVSLVNTSQNINVNSENFENISFNGGLNSLQSFVSYQINNKFTLGLKIEHIYGNNVDHNIVKEETYINNFPVSSTTTSTTEGDVTVSQDDIVTKSVLTESKTRTKITQNQFTLGGAYKIPVSKKSSFVLGATLGVGTKTNKKIEGENKLATDYTVRRYTKTTTDYYDTSIPDKVTNSAAILSSAETSNSYGTTYQNSLIETSLQPVRTSIDPMQNFSFAFGYEKEEKFMVGADFQFNKTGVYGNLITTKVSYQDRYRVALGGWWLPNKNSYKNYFQKVIYRAGLFYEQTPVVVDGQSINDIGASFGFGLPIGKKSQSSVNVGFEYIKRGTTKGLASELDYFGLRLGFNLTNKWFNQRLID